MTSNVDDHPEGIPSPKIDGMPEGGDRAMLERAEREMAALARGADLLAKLQTLKEGEAYRIPFHTWNDLLLPPELNPLTRMAIEDKVAWLLHRLPFPARATLDVMHMAYVIHRVPYA